MWPYIPPSPAEPSPSRPPRRVRVDEPDLAWWDRRPGIAVAFWTCWFYGWAIAMLLTS